MITKTSKIRRGRRSTPGSARRLLGTAERPRLNVYRSVNHIYAQVIDDAQGMTLVSASSVEKGKARARSAPPAATWPAKEVGKLIAERAKQKGITRSSSTAADTCITGASRPWPTPPAKPDCSSRSRGQGLAARGLVANSPDTQQLAHQRKEKGENVMPISKEKA